jgi:hypothetical protein
MGRRRKAVKINGTLAQLRSKSDRETPWIGWGIIGVLLTIVAFFGVGWLKNTDLKLAEVERDVKRLELIMQAEKVRVDTVTSQVGTVTAILDRIDGTLRQIEGRLTKMEVGENYRRNNK